MPSSSKSEVERKFLADRVPGELKGSPGTPVQQGYLVIDEESEVRIRRAGEALTLTIKNGHGESRQETEVDLDEAAFDELWPESEGRRVTKVRRRIELPDGLVAELDEYSGELKGSSVVEVEFASEADAAAFDPPAWFGRELTGDRAWANQSLAVHGKPEKSLEFRLRPGEDPATGICRVIAARSSQAAASVRRAGESGDSEKHVHEARKSLKKSRSALRLLRGVITDEERHAVNQTCRDASGHLSGARDAEVKLATLVTLVGEGESPEGADSWRDELEGEAESHRGDLTPEGLAEVARSIESVARKFRGREIPESDEQIAGNAGRGYRRGRKAMKKARKSDDPEQFHDWRKRAKDLRYQLEILEAALPGEYTETRRRAEKLADQLGDLHDLDVLAEDLGSRRLPPEDAKRLMALVGDARDRLEQDCFETGRATYETKPGSFTNGIAEALSGGA